MSPQRVLAAVGIGFGAAFVLINAGGFSSPWDVVVRVGGVILTAVAVWFGVVRRPATGLMRVAVVAEVVRLTAGVGWAPAAGAVLAGALLLAFWRRPRCRG